MKNLQLFDQNHGLSPIPFIKRRKSFIHDLFSRFMTWEHRGLQGVSGGYRGLQGVTRGYRGLQGVTRGYKGLQGVTRGDRGLQGVTGGYKGLQKLFSN